MKLLNLGCGNVFHSDWENIDFISFSSLVKVHDLKKGIPYPDGYFDFVYHSHVLEHFDKTQANFFLNECYRVLKPNGLMRIAIPNLEGIVREYLSILEKIRLGDLDSKNKYEWIILELLDQMTRKYPGGLMGDYLKQDDLKNFDYIINRLGSEAIIIRESNLKNQNSSITPKKVSLISHLRNLKNNTFPIFKKKIILDIVSFLLGNKEFKQKYKDFEFSNSGENHLWMYDDYSIKNALEFSGFKEIKKQSATESFFSKWVIYNFDLTPEGSIRKPDSIYFEAFK